MIQNKLLEWLYYSKYGVEILGNRKTDGKVFWLTKIKSQGDTENEVFVLNIRTEPLAFKEAHYSFLKSTKKLNLNLKKCQWIFWKSNQPFKSDLRQYYK